MNPIPLFVVVLLACVISSPAADPSVAPRWKEDFSDEAALKKTWTKYDSVLSGDRTQRYWQIEDGVLRGRGFAKIHPVGIMRMVSGKDLRLTCRVKLGVGAGIYLAIHGPNNGSDRVSLEQNDINFRRAGMHITANNEFTVYDEHYTHPDAEARKQDGVKHTAGTVVGVMLPLAVNVWHDLKVELRGKDLTIWIDGAQVKHHQTHSGDEPKKSVSFSVANESKQETADAWYDDISFETIDGTIK